MTDQEKEDAESLFSKADEAEMEAAGVLVSANKNIIPVRTKDGTAFHTVPCGEGFRKIADAEDHFDNCFKCHQLCGYILD